MFYQDIKIGINMATSPAEEVSSEDEIFFGKITMKEIRARFLPKEKRRALRHANWNKDIEMNGSDTSLKIIEMHSEPEMNIQNDWTDSSYGTTSSNKADYDIKTDGENSYLKLLPDDSFLRLEKQVADCSISDDTFQNHTSEMKCFDPPSNKQPMIANENVKQVAKAEQSHSFFNKNIDDLFHLEQDCKPQVQDNTPPHKHNPPTEENSYQVTPEVPKQHESAKSEITPLNNNNFLEPPVTEVISTPRENANNTDIFKTPKNTLSKKQQASSVTKSLRKVNTYQHVASPIALYIKRSPQAPLVHSVNPKPLPISHIPKLIKNPVKEISYKENTPLPRTVYRTPKETVVLTRDRKKISKDQQSNTTASTTAVVIRKHAPNEGNPKKEIVFQDDTINESLISQPDFSIHIENSTFY